MNDDFITDLKIMAGKMNKLIKTLPGQAGSLVLENVDDNFRSQSFDGDRWKARAQAPPKKKGKGASGNEGRAILVMSGRLRRSFRMTTSGLVITIATDVPYAEIHNEGGEVKQTVTITPKMRKFFFAMFKETKDEKWKKMALTKKATFERSFTMPVRKFLGENATLDKNMTYLLESELSAIFDR